MSTASATIPTIDLINQILESIIANNQIQIFDSPPV